MVKKPRPRLYLELDRGFATVLAGARVLLSTPILVARRKWRVPPLVSFSREILLGLLDANQYSFVDDNLLK